MPPRLQRSRKGDKVTAADRNDLIDAIEGGKPRLGAGLLGLYGNAVDLANREGLVLIPARVTGAPSGTEVEEPDCTYTIRAIHDQSWVLDGHKPGYGRMLQGAGVLMKPAPVGSFCFMVREWAGGGTYTVDAWVIKESYLTTFCPDPSPGPIAPQALTKRERDEMAMKGNLAGSVGSVVVSPAPIPTPGGGFE
jgi:hypothetical protein